MKAIVYERYGSPDVLELKEVEKPTPKDYEVLVKIYAASINSWDFDLLRGVPFLNRLFGGLLKPKHKILGADVAGRVEAVGKDVKILKVGDEVYGDLCKSGWGAFAEYVSAPEDALAKKPAGLTFEEAAAVPQAAVIALQGFQDKGQVYEGQKVLINGAGGGAGTFSVQLAKLFGAKVTGVDSVGKLDTMRSIGADAVIDYTKVDYTKTGERYDLIIDHAAYHSISDYRRVLNPKGIFTLVGGSTVLVFKTIFFGLLISMVSNKKMGVQIYKPKKKDLDFLREKLETGKLKPVIDKTYPLNETSKALRYFGTGDVKGKLVITIGNDF
ncbi:MAG: NAD(P)-dependent alcohol dehydrogenase [Deltaproteobacteria bacterium]|nr:NAD(P)-dependent alcohol dehydrogenase [Deltaproteobacteria bacterium]